jgi:cell division protein FtsN
MKASCQPFWGRFQFFEGFSYRLIQIQSDASLTLTPLSRYDFGKGLGMSEKAKVFIYSRRELGVLLILGALIAFFAFTLGVHLGKDVGGPVVLHPPSDPALVTPAEDQLAARQDLTEQGRVAPKIAEEVLDQSLQEEVKKQGVKLDVPRQIDLPQSVKVEQHSAAHAPIAATDASKEHAKENSKEAAHEHTPPAAANQAYDSETPGLKRPAPEGVYTLQVGSFSAAQEANDQIEALDSLGLKPYLRIVTVRGKRWHRVYLGGYASQTQADQAGARYLKQHLVESFVVAKMSDFAAPSE